MNVFIEGLTANGITGDFSGSRSGFIQFAWLWNTEIKIHLHDYNNWAALNAVIGAHVFTGGGYRFRQIMLTPSFPIEFTAKYKMNIFVLYVAVNSMFIKNE